ncbi:MAG: ATP-binding cassette domain-containing protein [Anaerolineae bacterium]
MINLQGLSYSYPGAALPVLRGVDLHVERGAFALVVGASGSGKSTLLRCINGLVPHFYGGVMSGHILVAGQNPVQRGPRGMSASVGFVFQDPESQFVVDTVEAELAFAMENHGLSQEVMSARIAQVLRRLDMAHLRNRRISTLSGGEKQRVALASALTLEPQVLVLDEPTSQLDPAGAEQVLVLLARLNRELGLTIVLSEHRLERVLPYVDQIVTLPGDGSVRSGPTREMLADIDQAPPLVSLARALGWSPLPLSVEEARSLLANTRPDAPPMPSRDGRRVLPGPVEIAVEALRYAYDDRVALQDIRFDVRRGEIVALMGANGSGKTTLLKHLVGLLQPSEGHVLVRGNDTRQVRLEDLIRTVGYVPQNPSALLFAETVRAEFAFTRKNHGLPATLPEGLLDALGIEPLMGQYPRDLSVGERQRVALGAILAAEPQIVLLDEPTRGVDRAQKEAFMRYLAGERSTGRTVIIATHDVELVAECADRLILLEGGRLIDDGPVREIMPRHPAYCSQIGLLYTVDGVLTPADVVGGAG